MESISFTWTAKLVFLFLRSEGFAISEVLWRYLLVDRTSLRCLVAPNRSIWRTFAEATEMSGDVVYWNVGMRV